MRKKAIALLLGAVMVCSLAGCGAKSTLENDYIKVNQYKDLQVTEVEEEEITDDRVQEVIDTRLEANPIKTEITDRAAQDGDVCNIDFSGSIDGEDIENGSSEGYDLTLGSDSFIGANGDYKGFEEQIVGHKTGDEFDITVQFPDDYSSEDLAGKVAKFHIVLNSITEQQDAELTDEWVQTVSDTSTTVDEYKKEIRQELEDSAYSTWLSSIEDELVDALESNIEVKELPEDKVQDQVDAYNAQYKTMAETYGIEWEDFLESYLGVTEEEFNETIQSYSERYVTIDLACKLIADELDLNPTDEELDGYYEKYIEQTGVEDKDELIAEYGEETVKSAAIQEKVLEYLANHCIQVEEDTTTTDSTSTTESTDSSSTSQ